MNKLGMAVSLAAVAAVAGCLDPDYKRPTVDIAPVPVVIAPGEPTEVKPAAPEPEEVVKQEAAPVEPTPVVEEVVEPEPEPAAPVAKPAPAPVPETTVYIVQRGDSLSKISKRYNIRIGSIKELNGLKDDRIRIGQKLKLPGKVDVGVQKAPEVKQSAPKAKPAAPATTVYKGEVKEYTVKSGDTLGAIAYSNGINIRQLKALNKLTSDNLRIGQKLLIPATKVEKPAAAKKPEVKKEAKAEPKAPVEEQAQPQDKNAGDAAKAEGESAEAKPDAAAADAAATDNGGQEELPVGDDSVGVDANDAVTQVETYVVKEGDDVMSIAVRFNTSSGAIRELNNLGEDDVPAAGTVLKLPPDASEVE